MSYDTSKPPTALELTAFILGFASVIIIGFALLPWTIKFYLWVVNHSCNFYSQYFDRVLGLKP